MKSPSGKEFCKVLERHDWELVRISGSHHIYTKPGNANRLSVPVHGNKPLKTETQRALMRQAGLTDTDL